jgi:hypothetical protein
VFSLNGSCTVEHPSPKQLVRVCRLSGAGATIHAIAATMTYTYRRTGDSRYVAAHDGATVRLLDPSSKGTLSLSAAGTVSNATLTSFTSRGSWRLGKRSGAWSRFRLGATGRFIFDGTEEHSLSGPERLSVRGTLTLQRLA